MAEFGEHDGAEEHLTKFNSEVRTMLKSYVTSVLPERLLFIRYVDILHMHIPVLWLFVDLVLLFWHRKDTSTDLAFLFIEGVAALFLSVPLALSVVIRFMRLTCCLNILITQSAWKRLLLSCCFWTPLGVAVQGLLWASLHTPFYVGADMDLRPLVCLPITLQALLVYRVFRAERGRGDVFRAEQRFRLGRPSTTGAAESPPGGKGDSPVLQEVSVGSTTTRGEEACNATVGTPAAVDDSARSPEQAREPDGLAAQVPPAAGYRSSEPESFELLSLCSI
eukprot:TRINITY_DN18118_c0_g2_i1.p2 TRINITY_DN18118_c0_g2~~TRINITY_DN18118_c0_g2_i1.p2  ORF type:complete len:279 (+),score=42.19 TRINITY_DN18118_c0_g2_i1:873-1709(+)